MGWSSGLIAGVRSPRLRVWISLKSIYFSSWPPKVKWSLVVGVQRPRLRVRTLLKFLILGVQNQVFNNKIKHINKWNCLVHRGWGCEVNHLGGKKWAGFFNRSLCRPITVAVWVSPDHLGFGLARSPVTIGHELDNLRQGRPAIWPDSLMSQSNPNRPTLIV